MSVIATAVRHLIAAGVTGDALVDAIADMEASQPKDAVAERRRAWDRERRRKARAGQSGGIPVDQVETADVTDDPALSRPPNENNSNPPTHTHPEKQTPRARKGHRLPEEWLPGLLPVEIATAVAAWPAGALERELARFRDWAASATGPNATKSNWDAAWRNWLRKVEDEGRYKRNGQSAPNQRFPGNSTLRELAERSIASG